MSEKKRSYPSHLYGTSCKSFDLIADSITNSLPMEVVKSCIQDISEFKGVNSVFLGLDMIVRDNRGGELSFHSDICQGGIR